ncbi:hypothetical protein [Snuella sedimenti]|uniref:DUF4878 domain-containing protein n=1 Tax=Snuella sedimenti TaxID=2798802 RepID=A0A8J7JDY2_9FLAO|nr:hypothetical protein [Snuella sedimenti]MBJ6369469.1 hypothetical protein [Snuella sedimenti]
MKINYILTIGLIILTISCGKSKKEIEQEKAQIELEQKALAERKEKERIHLEKIEVGKSKLKMELTNELDRLKKMLVQEKNNLNEINKFQLGRLSSTKEKQLTEQNQKINILNDYIRKLEKEISLTSLRETFDFQDTPEGVVNYIFQSAKSKDFSKLRNLCDPYGENDADTRRICLVEMQPTEMQNRFVESFENGRIMGNPKIENETAEIEIAFGQYSDKLEKIKLIKRMDKWYIGSY